VTLPQVVLDACGRAYTFSSAFFTAYLINVANKSFFWLTCYNLCSQQIVTLTIGTNTNIKGFLNVFVARGFLTSFVVLVSG
jgi:hypothetical protein